MLCRHCGVAVAENQIVCNHCGAAVAEKKSRAAKRVKLLWGTLIAVAVALAISGLAFADSVAAVCRSVFYSPKSQFFYAAQHPQADGNMLDGETPYSMLFQKQNGGGCKSSGVLTAGKQGGDSWLGEGLADASVSFEAEFNPDTGESFGQYLLREKDQTLLTLNVFRNKNLLGIQIPELYASYLAGENGSLDRAAEKLGLGYFPKSVLSAGEIAELFRNIDGEDGQEVLRTYAGLFFDFANSGDFQITRHVPFDQGDIHWTLNKITYCMDGKKLGRFLDVLLERAETDQALGKYFYQKLKKSENLAFLLPGMEEGLPEESVFCQALQKQIIETREDLQFVDFGMLQELRISYYVDFWGRNIKTKLALRLTDSESDLLSAGIYRAKERDNAVMGIRLQTQAGGQENEVILNWNKTASESQGGFTVYMTAPGGERLYASAELKHTGNNLFANGRLRISGEPLAGFEARGSLQVAGEQKYHTATDFDVLYFPAWGTGQETPLRQAFQLQCDYQFGNAVVPKVPASEVVNLNQTKDAGSILLEAAKNAEGWARQNAALFSPGGNNVPD